MDPRAALLEHLLGNFPGFPGGRDATNDSPLSRIINQKRADADGLDNGDEMLVQCLQELTTHCLEIMNSDGMPTTSTIADLNARNGHRSFDTGTFAMAADRMDQKYVLSWFYGACQDVIKRVNDGVTDQEEELVNTILTGVMHGTIAVPVVKCCGLPITDLALNAAAGAQEIITVVGQDRLGELLKADSDQPLEGLTFKKRRILLLLGVLKQQDLLKLLKDARPAFMKVQTYLVGGDRELAHHNTWVFETSLGLHEDPADTSASNPEEVKIDDMEGEVYLAGTEPASLRNREPASVN